ncbi:hypothetical protein [Fusobacterium sp. PH5-44]|uniref:hypothetical protein n=1 Tax=unclassified Fusobacterium TaxID=2648384 RepID=UPI003D1BDB14
MGEIKKYKTDPLKLFLLIIERCFILYIIYSVIEKINIFDNIILRQTMLVIGIAITIFSIYFENTVLTTDDNEITVIQRKKIKKFKFTDYILSTEMESSSSKILPFLFYAGKKLILINKHDNEQIIIKLSSLSKEDFLDIITFLEKITINKNETMPLNIENEFILPKKKMLRNYINNIIKTILILVVINFIFIKSELKELEGPIINNGTLAPEISKLLLIGLGLFALIFFTVFLPEYIKSKKMIPNRIKINDDSLEIDNEIFTFENIDRIEITSASSVNTFLSDKREMLLLLKKENISKKYLFGFRKKSSKGKYLFDEYKNFCELLHKVSLKTNTELIYK